MRFGGVPGSDLMMRGGTEMALDTDPVPCGCCNGPGIKRDTEPAPCGCESFCESSSESDEIIMASEDSMAHRNLNLDQA